MFCRKGVLKNFLKAHKKTQMSKSLINKVTGLHSATLLKEKTSIQVLSDEFCEIFKTFFFYSTPPTDCFCSTEKYFANKIEKTL